MTAVEERHQRHHRVMNKLAKWRLVFAGWQLGTRSRQDGEARAVKHHREATILLRAEVNAMTALLIRKGVFTQDEFMDEISAECVRLDADFERLFPGFSTEFDEVAGDEGVHLRLPEAAETMRRLGFPL